MNILLIQEHWDHILLQDNPNQVQIREPMILKMIGIRRSIILQLMIIIFTMLNKIEEKLLLLKAKKFADNLEGLESFSISLLENDNFSWHRDKLKKANAIDDRNDNVFFEQPAGADELISAVTSLLNIDTQFSCWLLYEGRCGIFVRVSDFHIFLVSIFKLNKTYDLSLIFESPDRVITISDNAYNVDIYYEIK